jgi:hypothetical protein
MDFQPKDVMRLSFKWPQDVSKREAADGSKDRHAIVFQNFGGGHMVAPVTSVPPAKSEEQYAIKLKPRLQQQLGLDPSRTSYIKMNYANHVTAPNPSIKHATNRKFGDPWKEGRVPEGLLAEMNKLKDLAMKDGKFRPQPIPKHDPEADMRKLKAQIQTPKTNAGKEPARRLPGDPGRRVDMEKRVILKAAERRDLASTTQARRSLSARDGGRTH